MEEYIWWKRYFDTDCIFINLESWGFWGGITLQMYLFHQQKYLVVLVLHLCIRRMIVFTLYVRCVLKIIKMRLNSTTLPISKEIWVTFVSGSPCYTVLTSAHSFIWWHQMAHIWKCIQILLNLLKWLKKIVILGCSALFDNGLWRLWRFSSIMEKFCCVLCKCLIQIDYQLLIFQNKLFNVSSLLFYFKKR